MSVDPFALPRFGCVKVKDHDRAYQLRLEQLTLKNVSKIFNLIPDTILLVSTDGTVALPDERGRFSDVGDMGSDKWTVEGTESSNRSSGSAFLSTPSGPGPSGRAASGNSGSKPSVFFPARGPSVSTGSSGSNKTLPVRVIPTV